MCYYCANGLPPKVKEIFDEVQNLCPNFEFGLGHVVYSDFNLDKTNIEGCLADFNNPEKVKWIQKERSLNNEEMEACQIGLIKLLALTDEEREIKQASEYEC